MPRADFRKDEAGVLRDDNDRVVRYKGDKHVLDPNSDEAVQVTHPTVADQSEVYEQPSPEDVFSGSQEDSADADDSGDDE